MQKKTFSGLKQVNRGGIICDEELDRYSDGHLTFTKEMSTTKNASLTTPDSNYNHSAEDKAKYSSLNQSSQITVEPKHLSFSRVKSVYDNLVEVDNAPNKLTNGTIYPVHLNNQGGITDQQNITESKYNRRDKKIGSPMPASKRVSLNSLLTECEEYINKGKMGFKSVATASNEMECYQQCQESLKAMTIQQEIYSVPRKQEAVKNGFPHENYEDFCVNEGKSTTTMGLNVSSNNDKTPIKHQKHATSTNREAYDNKLESTTIHDPIPDAYLKDARNKYMSNDNQKTNEKYFPKISKTAEVHEQKKGGIQYQVEKETSVEEHSMVNTTGVRNNIKETMLSWPDVIPSGKRNVVDPMIKAEDMSRSTVLSNQLQDFKCPGLKEDKQTTSVSKVQNWIKINQKHHQEQETCK